MKDIEALPLSAGIDEYRRQAVEYLKGSQQELASWYQFENWAMLEQWVAQVTQQGSLVWQFETAVQAIVTGDETMLQRLLRENPSLIRERSLREHRATLLIYVGANGVEVQKTPRNAVRIAEILLDAGADIDAIGQMYGGTTTLGLVATSVHPVVTGVQEPLMQLLLDRGASMDRAVAADYRNGLVVSACLANGRPAAAEFLADRGATLDLEGAAGVGRLDVLKSYFPADGAAAKATPDQVKAALHWACGFGHAAVVDFLLNKGVDIKARYGGATALHWAGGGGHLDIVKRLLENGVPASVQDQHYDATPLEWALYGWTHPAPDSKPGQYHEVVALLAETGSSIHPEWLESDTLRADARMMEALRPLDNTSA
ncbi:MAG: ankyrin repeat domain-containing protein [Gemmatimonadaceae bacterium]